MDKTMFTIITNITTQSLEINLYFKLKFLTYISYYFSAE